MTPEERARRHARDIRDAVPMTPAQLADAIMSGRVPDVPVRLVPPDDADTPVVAKGGAP